MPLALIVLLLAVVPGHQDWSQIPKMCESCHVGHGVAGEKLLPMSDPAFCLQCHGSAGDAAVMVRKGYLAAYARPQSLSSALAQPYRHPEDEGCLACHAGHGVEKTQGEAGKTPKISPKSLKQYEYESCQPCHSDNVVYLSPQSAHPVASLLAARPVPSLIPPLAHGTWLGCSDCHGMEENGEPKGVHASPYPAIIKKHYQFQDGSEESEKEYALCYGCHSRKSILADESFPLHKKHIVDVRASCYTCHDTHGSRMLPFLLTIEDGKRNDRIFPDGFGRKTFESTGGRSGVCYLTCHNVEHDGWAYGPEGAKRSLKSGKMKRSIRARKELTGIRSKN